MAAQDGDDHEVDPRREEGAAAPEGETPTASDPWAEPEGPGDQPPPPVAPDDTVAGPPPDAGGAPGPAAPSGPGVPPVSDAPTVAAPPGLPPAPGPPLLGPAREGGPSGTAVMPPVSPPPEPRWAGRATVPRPARVEDQPEPWAEPPRGIVVPVLVTICVMLLLGVLGLGAWLILANRPSPTPSSAPSTTASLTPTTPTPTSSPPTAPTSVSPVTVPVPGVVGDDYETAAGTMTANGLNPVRRDEFNEAPAGTVLGTDPAEGTPVPPGTIVTIIVSLGPEPSPSPSDSPVPTDGGT